MDLVRGLPTIECGRECKIARGIHPGKTLRPKGHNRFLSPLAVGGYARTCRHGEDQMPVVAVGRAVLEKCAAQPQQLVNLTSCPFLFRNLTICSRIP